jgi:hypothetical protein
MESDLFKNHKKRLNVLDENIRIAALKYAKEFYLSKKCSKEEALERGIVKAEMKNRKL